MVKRTTPVRKPANIDFVIRKAVALLQPDLRHSLIDLKEDCQADLPELHVDPLQIEQVLVNLIRNAMDAMQGLPQDQRQIVISTAMTDDRQIEVRVWDNGTGLPPDQLETIFDAFNTTKPHGMGMGLAICRSIAESHAGRLTAENGLKSGAIFRLILPVVDPEVQE